MDKVVAWPRRSDTVQVNPILDFLSDSAGVFTGNHMNLDSLCDECVGKVIDMAGNASDDLGRVFPGQHDDAHSNYPYQMGSSTIFVADERTVRASAAKILLNEFLLWGRRILTT
jgi:hypothetical protein